MYFGENLQYLRKQRGMTQEKLAQHLNVTRQSVSKWESGDTVPELTTLIQIAEMFSCDLDALLRQELSPVESSVRIVRVRGFRMAKHCIISPNAMDDLQFLLRNWADNQGLGQPPLLLWRFAYVSEEQKRFFMEGFEGACVLPPDIVVPHCPFTIQEQPDCTYARITIPTPNDRTNSRISQGIHGILAFLQERGIRKTAAEGILPCFEVHRTEEDLPVIDLYLQCQGADFTEEITLQLTY